MSLPAPVETLWNDLEAVRGEILAEVKGLSQAQADWRPAEAEWSVGEILHHLTLAEVATGKLTSKLLKDAGPTASPFPADAAGLRAFPVVSIGGAQAPASVLPEHGHPVDELIATMVATRDRSRHSIERVAAVDPRSLTWAHPRFGELDLWQWWQLQARHDGDHLGQLRAVKAADGFPHQ